MSRDYKGTLDKAMAAVKVAAANMKESEQPPPDPTDGGSGAATRDEIARVKNAADELKARIDAAAAKACSPTSGPKSS